MKETILTGWTWTRALYTVLGVSIVLYAIAQREWAGILIGGYFASMGIFSFGCAAGTCIGRACDTGQAANTSNGKTQEPGP